jgi:hypothetical protein
VAGSCEHDDEPYGSIKGEKCQLAERLVVSQ